MADSAAAQPPAVRAPSAGRQFTVDRVLALAPDLASQRAATRLAGTGSWAETGCGDGDGGLPLTVWGLARGSGAAPYQTAVDVTGPGYRCSCPSRKFPCKHALGLLLHWSSGAVGAAPVPGWVRQWHAERAERAERAAAAAGVTDGTAGGDGAGGDGAGDEAAGGAAGAGSARRPGERAVAARRERVASGLDELDRWLGDQVRTGLAGLAGAGYAPWDAVAARLVDAKASTVAGVVRRLAAVAGSPDRLLAELALLRLLISGYRRLDELPDGLAATVRARAGLPVPTDQVLTEQPPLRDTWHVVGVRDEQEEQLQVRRVWLSGRHTGAPALVLGFAGPGQPLAVDLVLGTGLDADLRFYPGATPLRALVAARHAPPVPAGPPAGLDIRAALRAWAMALAGDPWLERWPVLLAGVVPVRDRAGWHLAEPDGTALPVDPASGDPWRLVGAAAGRPVTVAGEWSVAGLRPLTAWPGGRLVRL